MLNSWVPHRETALDETSSLPHSWAPPEHSTPEAAYCACIAASVLPHFSVPTCHTQVEWAYNTVKQPHKSAVRKARPPVQ
eukprot:248258-Chlamydomonas_euryale.AAC.1